MEPDGYLGAWRTLSWGYAGYGGCRRHHCILSVIFTIYIQYTVVLKEIAFLNPLQKEWNSLNKTSHIFEFLMGQYKSYFAHNLSWLWIIWHLKETLAIFTKLIPRRNFNFANFRIYSSKISRWRNIVILIVTTFNLEKQQNVFICPS